MTSRMAFTLAKMNDWRIKFDVEQDISEVRAIVDSQIVERGEPKVFFRAAVTRLSICIRDLVAKSQILAKKKISFTDDVIIEAPVNDVSSLVKFMRNAMCHVDTDLHLLDAGVYFSMEIVRGKATSHQMSGRSFGSDYADDVAFLIGPQRIYYRRHLIRAFDEAVANLESHFRDNLC
ncbi:MAG: hypothetical protein JW706_00705 [Opitutales bacterium]|nr:hypothetical protein [Opitutales bacterium]